VRVADAIFELLKITKQVLERSKSENDEEAVLLRAYGNDSEVLVDRDMEATTRALLVQLGLTATSAYPL
jgi:ethanolamine kinase